MQHLGRHLGSIQLTERPPVCTPGLYPSAHRASTRLHTPSAHPSAHRASTRLHTGPLPVYTPGLYPSIHRASTRLHIPSAHPSTPSTTAPLVASAQAQ